MQINKLLGTCLLCAWVWGQQANAQESIKVGDTTRNMITYAPEGLPYNRPLVISLHGLNQDADYQKGQANWEAVADTAKFVVVYPNGVNKAWDISGDTDIKFLETIIDTMYNRYHIDRNRVYLSGFSMGGMMTYHAMARMSDKIAAFGPVSGIPVDYRNPSGGRLLKDLGLKAKDVPLLAGEVVHADQGGVCASMNNIIRTLPQVIPTADVVSSAGCTCATDSLHFDAAGYRELGRRYAEKMLFLLGKNSR